MRNDGREIDSGVLGDRLVVEVDRRGRVATLELADEKVQQYSHYQEGQRGYCPFGLETRKIDSNLDLEAVGWA